LTADDTVKGFVKDAENALLLGERFRELDEELLNLQFGDGLSC